MEMHHAFQSFGSHPSRRWRIATLGPSGTSSEYAAKFISECLKGDVILYDTYEAAAASLSAPDNNDFLLVANAYSGVNRFYISRVLQPVAAFFHDTQPYVLACLDGTNLDRDDLKVASHPAPSHLAQELLPGRCIQVVPVPSTVRAAELTAEGQCDACITTLPTSERMRLSVVEQGMQCIPMLWTIFVRRDLREERKVTCSKASLILSEDLSVGQKANIATILGMSLSKAHPELVGRDLCDRDGIVFPGITSIPIPVLQADPGKLRDIARAASADNCWAACFTNAAMTTKTYGDYEATLSKATSAENPLLGVVVLGDKKAINKLVGNLALVR